jgi:hypothetical protein
VKRGKERPYFQILNETACVANAYKRLSEQAAEGMARTEVKARLEKEYDNLRQSMSKKKHSKTRSEPIGVDCSGRLYWVLKKDPNFIFMQVELLRQEGAVFSFILSDSFVTQTHICGEEVWGYFEGVEDIRNLLAGLDFP